MISGDPTPRLFAAGAALTGTGILMCRSEPSWDGILVGLLCLGLWALGTLAARPARPSRRARPTRPMILEAVVVETPRAAPLLLPPPDDGRCPDRRLAAARGADPPAAGRRAAHPSPPVRPAGAIQVKRDAPVRRERASGTGCGAVIARRAGRCGAVAGFCRSTDPVRPELAESQPRRQHGGQG
ncbi:hypothetical protein ACFQEW_27490 [Methylobacterium tardum]